MKQYLLNEESSPGSLVELSGDAYHYLVRVRRTRPGDILHARTPSGAALRLEVVEVDEHALRCRATAPDDQSADYQSANERSPDDLRAGGTRSNVPESGAQAAGAGSEPTLASLCLVQALPKGKKTDQILRQASEAGVARIVLVKTAHAVPDFNEREFEGKAQRWNKILQEAVQQSGSPRLPRLDYYKSFDAYLQSHINLPPGAFFHQDPPGTMSLHRFVHYFRQLQSESGQLNRDAGQGAYDETPALPEMHLCIGPEGGFSDQECIKFEKASFQRIFLGDTILRTETAGIYVLGAVKTLLNEETDWILRD